MFAKGGFYIINPEHIPERFEASASRPNLQLYLPNLQVKKVHVNWTLRDNEDHLVVRADIQNVGIAPSKECRISARIELAPFDPLVTNPTLSHDCTSSCPALAPGEVRYYLEICTIPLQLERPVGGQAIVIVDPPTSNNPGGEVWESNETDNVGMKQFIFVAGGPDTGDWPPQEPPDLGEAGPPDPPPI